MVSDGTPRQSEGIGAFVRSLPWRRVLLDLLFVVAWFAAVSLVFRAVQAPTWLYYVVVFGGVVGYSIATGRRDSRES